MLERFIIPSLLAANPLKIFDELESLMAHGIKMIHFDVMDQHYVPNLSFGPQFCSAIHQAFPALFIDVHLMTFKLDEQIHAFAKAGANRISIHADSTIHLNRSLQLIKDLSCEAGLAINPSNSLDAVLWNDHLLDFMLIMTVNPGYGGQKLIPQMITKIAQAHATYPHIPIAVDGGIGLKNMANLINAGASQFIIGSDLFGQKDYKSYIQQINEALI